MEQIVVDISLFVAGCILGWIINEWAGVSPMRWCWASLMLVLLFGGLLRA